MSLSKEELEKMRATLEEAFEIATTDYKNNIDVFNRRDYITALATTAQALLTVEDKLDALNPPAPRPPHKPGYR